MFLDFNGVYEPETVAAGEAQLRVLECKIGHSEKTGGDYLQVRFDIPANSKAKDISHVMMLPTQQDDSKKKNSRLAAIQNFFRACGVENVNNVDELVGATPWAILAEEDSVEFGKQNRIKKFVVAK